MIDVLTDPKIWILILTISALGAFARLPNYYAGLRGKETIITLYPRIEPQTWERVLKAYRNLGPLPLLIASIPIIGTLLTVSAGMAEINRTLFIIFVIISKVIRNWILFLLFFRLI
jgi:membrane protein YqaA with SNARE-associated domain